MRFAKYFWFIPQILFLLILSFFSCNPYFKFLFLWHKHFLFTFKSEFIKKNNSFLYTSVVWSRATWTISRPKLIAKQNYARKSFLIFSEKKKHPGKNFSHPRLEPKLAQHPKLSKKFVILFWKNFYVCLRKNVLCSDTLVRKKKVFQIKIVFHNY